MDILAAIVPCLCLILFVCGIVLLSTVIVGGRSDKRDDDGCPRGDVL